jgi:hypothetical protein
MSDKKRHGFYRRIANPLFSQTFLTQLEPTMKDYISLFVSGITEEAKSANDGVVEITKWIDNFAFDVSGAISLGKDFNALKEVNCSEIEVVGQRWMFISKVCLLEVTDAGIRNSLVHADRLALGTITG